ncbi:MAG: DUF4158 domain-containing protein [Gammaproteobacteria bacterium]|nr:DUF4158 domain-containing protein [Gammaproteobacteria bacterium]
MHKLLLNWQQLIATNQCQLDSEELQWLKMQRRYPVQQLALAVMLKYFQLHGRYPSPIEPPPAFLVEHIATQLNLSNTTLDKFKWHYNSRTVQRLKKLIRDKLDVRLLRRVDTQQFIAWFKSEIAPTAPTPVQALHYATEYFAQAKIEAWFKSGLHLTVIPMVSSSEHFR